MPFAPAEKNSMCAECTEISRQLNDVHFDGPSESALGAEHGQIDRERTRAAVDALRSMIGGTEEDAERADRLLQPYRYKPRQYLAEISPVAMPVVRRLVHHAARTGHWLRRISG
ncbi:MAG TPA: hypothetical protein VFW94_03630 [Candidatus Acidoferrales bacterium]|nr:hypothetical protein [Candidatus Acidoferrales bacterium]